MFLARDRDMMEHLHWIVKWLIFGGGLVRAAAEAAAGAAAAGGTGDTVNADVDATVFVSY